MREKNKNGKEKPEKPPGFFSFILDSLKKRNFDPEAPPQSMIRKIEAILEEYLITRDRHKKNLSTYEQISGSSQLSSEFFILLISSSLIAAFGLLQNSAAVIIGAMIIAPLMMPILGFALGSIWGDKQLITQALITLATGISSAIALTMIIGFILPGVENNEQILARTNPSLYDIIVALASGFVGAYAFVNPKISGSISGVAIAVALIPPLAVTGICLGTFQWSAALGSFLLFSSNLVGISLSASIVFWKMKVHPAASDETEINERAKRNFFLSTALLVLISVPLVYFMKETLYVKSQAHKIENAVRDSLSIEDVSVTLNRYFDKYHVVCRVITTDEITAEKKNQLHSEIKALFSAPAEVKLILLRSM